MTERNTRTEQWAYAGFPLTNAEAAEKGKRAFLDTVTGKATITSTSKTVDIGVFDESRTGDGSTEVVVKLHEQVVLRRWDNDTGTAVASTDLGKICFIKDSATVSMSSVGGRREAGRVFAVTSYGVLVQSHAAAAGPRPQPRGATLTYASNDAILGDYPASGTAFDIPTTGAASTVTLPANAIDGTTLQFTADGAKNGHTVQYRDATGPANLTTALTASKRHLVIATFMGGKWFANAYVSP